MRTLLTGFGPFGRVVNNPSARIVEHFGRVGAPGHDLTTQVLPVSYARAEQQIRDLLSASRFDSALLLGVAVRECQLRLEALGRWQLGRRSDCDGRVPASTDRRPGALDQYRATVDLEPLLNDLIDAGLPARLSHDAGRYVCNHTYYAALHAIAAQELPTCCLFLHVPADPQTFAAPHDVRTMPLERQITAVERILSRLSRLEPAAAQRHLGG